MVRRFFVKINGLIYKYLAKPILFVIPPDKTHSDMILVTSAVGKSAIVRNITKAIFKGEPDARLSQKLFGIEFYSPLGLSA